MLFARFISLRMRLLTLCLPLLIAGCGEDGQTVALRQKLTQQQDALSTRLAEVDREFATLSATLTGLNREINFGKSAAARKSESATQRPDPASFKAMVDKATVEHDELELTVNALRKEVANYVKDNP